MIPPELYWPADLLAAAMPEKYGHLIGKVEPSQRAAGSAPASPSAPRSYTVEPVAGGCAVIRPRFGGGIRSRERKGP